MYDSIEIRSPEIPGQLLLDIFYKSKIIDKKC